MNMKKYFKLNYEDEDQAKYNFNPIIIDRKNT